jgi:hypothetical protein
VVADGDSTEFAMPIAGLLFGKGLGKEGLLPRDYRGILVQERVLRYSTAIFCIISFLCLGYILSGWNQAHQIRKMIAPLKAEIAGKAEIYKEFESRNSELQAILPFMKYLNNEMSAPDMHKSLVSLQALNRDKVKVKDIEIKNTGIELAFQIKGQISSSSYGELQSRFRKLVDDMRSIDGVIGVSEKLDLVSKDFTIELTWRQ